MANDGSQNTEFDIVVIGAGPAGVGVGIVLQKLGLNYVILERRSVAASFKKWPKETRLISPSFAGNSFQMPDLNAISIHSSPAYGLQTEHPSGEQYAKYLEDVAQHYELSVQDGIDVNKVRKENGSFIMETSDGEYRSRFVIWAGGEFQYPKEAAFEGDDLCIHYSKVTSFADLKGDDRIVIGAYESGFDSAYQLAKRGKKITLLDSADYMELITSDSSYSLSPFTRDRVNEIVDDISYHKQIRVEKVEVDEGKYTVTTTDGQTFTSGSEPINCTGFASSLSLVTDLFEFKGKYPLLTGSDESTITENLFLVGPQVKHGKALFCFIYKFRQRFAIVAERIATVTGLDPETINKVVQEYKARNFYLKNLSATGEEIEC